MNYQAKETIKGILIASVACVLIGWFVSYVSELTFFAAIFGTALVLWIHGSIVAWEDDLPGGYDNPTDVIPEHRKDLDKLKYWAGTLFGALVLGLIAGYCGLNDY
jgi:uncharacterized membrane protein YfcA